MASRRSETTWKRLEGAKQCASNCAVQKSIIKRGNLEQGRYIFLQPSCLVILVIAKTTPMENKACHSVLLPRALPLFSSYKLLHFALHSANNKFCINASSSMIAYH